MAEHVFDEMKRYVRFGPGDERLLLELGPLFHDHLPAVIDEFYARIEEHPGAVAVISGGAAQIERLKQTLLKWLATFFRGPWDEAYFDHRSAIGRRHVAIQLPQQYNFTAMNVIRVHLNRLCGELTPDTSLAEQRVAAIDKLVDLELAIIFLTYNAAMTDQLRRGERLATFGQITSTIAHELRNPLGVIDTSAFLLQRRVGEDPATLGHIEKIRAQVARSNRIITSLLDIVRDKPPSQRRMAAAQLAERAAAGLRDDRGVELELHTESALPDVSVDPEQLQQVLLNLLANASDAAGPDGSVRLRVGRREQHVEFVVSDSGAGIDPNLSGRLFEPLVTTKSTGVGLGLALCRKVVAAHAGAVLELATTRDPQDLPGANFSLRLLALD